MFKREKVLPAIDEINSKTGLFIELIESKKGKAVADVQFKVRRVSSGTFVVDVAKSGPCYVQAAKLGIPQKDITIFLEREHEPFTENQVLLALAKIEAQVKKVGAKPVENIAGYFRKVMTEVEGGGRNVPSQAKLEKLPSPVQTPLTFDRPNEPPVSEAVAKLSKRAIIANEFLSLPEDQQLIYVNVARDRLKSKGLLTPAMIRKLEGGSWNTGIILDAILQRYGSENYGPHWNVEDIDGSPEAGH